MRDVLIITGPTASGKTALSELVARDYPSEIINADMGQFYTPLSIGTAKPTLSTLFYPAHGFNLLNEPRDLSVVAYRSFVVDLVHQIRTRNQLPVLVGGSLFYLKSLFFPPIEPESKITSLSPKLGGARSWQALYEIDPDRAARIHPNDGYRIGRALDLWYATGVKPSCYKPVFNPPFKAHIIFMCPERKQLHENIKKRVNVMLQQGWIEETEVLIGTDWEPFLQKKGLIGYPVLIDWIKQGKRVDTFESVVAKIELDTLAYAKRQVTFWKSFVKQLEEIGACSEGGVCSVQEISQIELLSFT